MSASTALLFTFIGGLAVVGLYALVALTRGKKPTFEVVYKLLGGSIGVVSAVRILWLVIENQVAREPLPGLEGQDKFYVFIGAIAAGWYGLKAILGTFGRLLNIELEEDRE